MGPGGKTGSGHAAAKTDYINWGQSIRFGIVAELAILILAPALDPACRGERAGMVNYL